MSEYGWKIFCFIRLESDGHFARAAAIALFNLELRKAIEVLSRGASSKNYKGMKHVSLFLLSKQWFNKSKYLEFWNLKV